MEVINIEIIKKPLRPIFSKCRLSQSKKIVCSETARNKNMPKGTPMIPKIIINIEK